MKIHCDNIRYLSRYAVLYPVVAVIVLCTGLSQASITWNVSGSGNWDTSTANWIGDSSTFTDNGTVDVIFNNPSGGTITISANMTPKSISVAAGSGTYVFSGGLIDGSGALTKSGGGTLNLASANTFSGGITLSGGSLTFGVGTSTTAASGTGTITINSGTYIGGPGPGAVATLANNNPLVLNADFTAGDIDFGTGAVTLNTSLAMTIGNSVNMGGIITGPGSLNALDIIMTAHGGWAFGPTLSGAITLRGNQTCRIDGQGGWNCLIISGAIGDGGNGYGITVDTGTGSANLYLSGTTNSYSGKSAVKANCTLSFKSIANVGSACSLGKPVTAVNGAIDIYPGGTLRPGAQGTFITDRLVNLAGSGGGTSTVQVTGNDTFLTFGGATATGTGARTLLLSTGGSNGDRDTMTVTGSIPDMSDASQVTLQIGGNTQTPSSNVVTLAGVNTFTGPFNITMSTGNGGNMYVVISGSGQLGSGNYTNNVSIGTGCTLIYSSSASQIFSGGISCVGAGVLNVGSSSAVTLGGISAGTGCLFKRGTGTLTIGSGATAGMIDLGSGSVINATNPLTVTNAANIAGVMLSMSSGESFTISGADLLNPSASNRRVLTLSSGTLRITPGMSDGIIGGASSVSSYFNPRTGVWGLVGTGVGSPQGDNHAWRYITMPTGDFDIKAHYTGGGGSWRRVGLMARDSLSQNTGNYAAIWGADNGCQAVGVAGVTTYDESIPNLPWMEIKKVGNTVTLYNSSDGISYIQRMSTNSVWGPTMYLGLDVNYGTIYATWDNVNFMGGSTTNIPNWNTSDIVITGTGRLDLNYIGTCVLSGLYINSSLKAPGTYGATGSGATNIDDVHFLGTGTVTSTKPLAGFLMTLR